MRRRLARGVIPPGLDLERLLVVFDFDGTLAPLVRLPHRATIPLETRRSLSALARQVPVCVLSGRARADLLPRLGRVKVRHAIGNHGSEWTSNPPPRQLRARVARWRRAIEPVVERYEGAWIEDKGWSLSIHTRAVDEPKVARRVRSIVAKRAPDAAVHEGKDVVNVWPPGADKASAVERLRDKFRSRTILFVGDDTNDELVFAAKMARVVTIRVGPVTRTAARWVLADQRDVAPLLAALVASTRAR